MNFDLHTHSRYSFNGSVPVDDLCGAAVNHHVDVLTIMDHCDMLPGPEGSPIWRARQTAPKA